MLARNASRSPASSPCVRAWIRTLPIAVASTGPAITGTPTRSATSWHSKPVLGAPADDVHGFRRRAGEQRGSLDTVGEGGSEALDDGSRGFGHCGRSIQTPRVVPRGDAAWHVSGSLEGGVVGVEDLGRGRARGGLLEEFGEVDAGAAALPVSDRFTKQPEAHDVAQEAYSSVCADLIGEVGRPGRLGQHRSVQFNADQSPGATGDVDG